MSRVKWLSAEEQRTWRAMLQMYQDLFDGLDKQLRAEAGIPHAYYIILAMLSEAPDRTLRMSELAAATSTSPSRTTHAVAALEARGWVERSVCETDRRGQLATLTDDGFANLKELAPLHVAEVRRLVFDRLTKDQTRQLGEIANRVNDTDFH